jgi:hypothetical protein
MILMKLVLVLVLVLLLLGLVYAHQPGLYSLNSLSIPKTSDNARGFTTSTPNTGIDESFYSRQLLVYGKTAQNKLLNAKVLIIGDGGMLEEVVKNLALSGVGTIVLAQDSIASAENDDKNDRNSDNSVHNNGRSRSRPSLLGNESSLIKYAKALNPHVQVGSIQYIYIYM